MTQTNRIVIAAATFKRPEGLSRLLDGIEALDTNALVRVVICDNDINGQAGRAVVKARVLAGFRFELECIVAEQRGISHARNALFKNIHERGDCDFIAIIDDDEWPEPQWLNAFESMALQTNADILAGPVVSVFESTEVTTPVAECEQFRRKQKSSGLVPIVLSTENAFLKSGTLDLIEQPWFDSQFAFTGGEDADLFYRFKRAGASFAWSDQAVVNELVPTSRSTAQWALKRNFRRGSNTAWRALRRPGKLKSITRIVFLGLAGIISYPFFWVLNFNRPTKRLDAKLRLWRALGYFSGFAQVRVQDYNEVHGR